MSEGRRRVMMGLLLLMCALTEHRAESAPFQATTKTAGGNAQRNTRRVVEIVRHVEGSRGRQGTGRTESPVTSRTGSPSWDRDLSSRTDRRNQAIVFTDLKMKEKIIKHFTGPLVFSSKCRKTAYKVYHQTRDCTIPAYFKRCARLLTRLAGSPLCTEG